MPGIRNPRFFLLLVVRDNCRGCHGLKASFADVPVDLAKNDPTILHSHVRAKGIIDVLAYRRNRFTMTGYVGNGEPCDGIAFTYPKVVDVTPPAAF